MYSEVTITGEVLVSHERLVWKQPHHSNRHCSQHSLGDCVWRPEVFTACIWGCCSWQRGQTCFVYTVACALSTNRVVSPGVFALLVLSINLRDSKRTCSLLQAHLGCDQHASYDHSGAHTYSFTAWRLREGQRAPFTSFAGQSSSPS